MTKSGIDASKIARLPRTTEEKLTVLRGIVQNLDAVAIAYSGGVDSTLLLALCKDILGEQVLAVIAQSETYPEREIEFATSMASRLGVCFIVVETTELSEENFLKNLEDRCYWCKRELFSQMVGIAKQSGIDVVADGTNFDDLSDFRPGLKAADEFGIRKPLAEAKLTKDEVRLVSRFLGLPTWNKPSLACLASRFPYGTRIDVEKLKKIDEIERLILHLGVTQVRVRHFGHTAKIEVADSDLGRVIAHRKKISNYCRKLGYLFVTLDLEGYRTGSMNKLLNRGI